MLWLMAKGLLGVLAAKQAYNYMTVVLHNGDEFEKAAIEHWREACAKHQRGWLQEFVLLVQRLGLLESMGGQDKILRWEAADADRWRTVFYDACGGRAANDIVNVLQKGKYGWMASVLPAWDSPRPWACSLGSRRGRVLYRWMLSSHKLEIETGRYEGIPRPQRWCRRCLSALGIQMVGDEEHCLSVCVRAADARKQAEEAIRDVMLQGEAANCIGNLADMIGRMHVLDRLHQRRCWEKLADYMIAVEAEWEIEGNIPSPSVRSSR